MDTRPAFDVDPILRRIAAGEREAFADIVRQFQRPLFGFLGRMGLAPALADELAQETFVRAWRGLDGYRPARGAFSTWLYTIARNLAVDALARHGRDDRGSPDAIVVDRFADGRDDADAVPEDGDAPAERFEQRDAQRRLHAALRRLPVADRAVIALFYLAERDLADVARIEGTTVGAIKVRLHRARQRLRALMEHDDER
jgi:RNA polymerase sigma-70 factor (ECF subfamily)